VGGEWEGALEVWGESGREQVPSRGMLWVTWL
jgi:hypothetical protein